MNKSIKVGSESLINKVRMVVTKDLSSCRGVTIKDSISISVNEIVSLGLLEINEPLISI